MKKTTFFLSLIVLFSLSCNKKYKFYAFYIENTFEIEFPESSVGDFESIQDISLYIDNILDAQSTKAGLIEEITIEEIRLKQTDFDKFNELDLFISAEGISEISLGSSDTTDLNSNVVLLNVSKDKMDDYVKASLFSIRSTGQISSQEAQAFTVPVNLKFLVKTYVK